MTSGITNRPMAGTKVALAPAALAALLGGALLAGGLIGAAVSSEVGALSRAAAAGQIVATSPSAQSQAFRRDAQMKLGRGAFVQDAPQGVATVVTRQVGSVVRDSQLAVGRGPLEGASTSSGTSIVLPSVVTAPYVAVKHADGRGFQR